MVEDCGGDQNDHVSVDKGGSAHFLSGQRLVGKDEIVKAVPRLSSQSYRTTLKMLLGLPILPHAQALLDAVSAPSPFVQIFLVDEQTLASARVPPRCRGGCAVVV